MPEEKKKDSFTFSDKIKNSKPAASKSFANRISSKIGSDGKPKKTLFERTKRDAPFFIAAIVALLLLPFLYKYSGQVGEEPMVTPGSEESMFDPERYGFDTAMGDPDGQIAQLAGRDPLSLIKGFGTAEPVADDSHMYDIDRSGLADTATSSTDVTNNRTEYRTNAAPQTRAAFRRAATKIGTLSSAGLTSRGGGKLGVGMWGGSLKSAAKTVGADGPRNSPKPVSLQPLQAAGKPSRSYFGQGAAAEARRSKDALSKGNAMQALADAQMRPIDAGKIGGLGSGAFGPGGGGGDLKRAFAFNGKEPWWWDMMKKRSQMEWEADFNRKWDWIKWGDKLAQGFLNGVLSCLATGTDDWSMGNMFGAQAGSGNPDKCGELKKADWDTCTKCKEYGEFNKANCKNYLASLGSDSSMVKKGWQGGNIAGATMGPITQRIDCLSNGLGAKLASKWFGDKKGALAEDSDCHKFETDGIYKADVSGKGDWSVFHYVVGIPTAKLSTYYNVAPDQQKQMLVVGYLGSGATFNSNISDIKDRTSFVPLFVESVAIKSKKLGSSKADSAPKYQRDYDKSVAGAEQVQDAKISNASADAAKALEAELADCRQNVSDAKALKACMDGARGRAAGKVAGASQNAGNSYKQAKTSAKQARQDGKAVYEIRGGDLPEDTVDAMSILSTQTANGGMLKYSELINILRKGGMVRDAYTNSDNVKTQLSVSTKGSKEGKNWVTGARCTFPIVRISCDYFATVNTTGTDVKDGETVQLGPKAVPFAHLTFSNGLRGNAAAYQTMQDKFMISYTIQSEGNTFAKAMGSNGKSNKYEQLNVVPHADVRPFDATWRTQDRGVKNSIGTANNSGSDYQVLATEVLKLQDAPSRLIINWQISQCDSIDVDGSSITKGGCNTGTKYRTVVDKDGKETSGTALGQSLSGNVVSSATCVYFNNSDLSVVAEPVAAAEVDECLKDNKWQRDANCCSKYAAQHPELNLAWDGKACSKKPEIVAPVSGGSGVAPVAAPVVLPFVTFAPKVNQVPAAFNDRQPNGVFGKAKYDNAQSKNCSVINNVALTSPTAQQFVAQVADAYKAKTGVEIANPGADLSVAQFIDALNIAPQAGINKVPAQAICGLTRQLSAYGHDANVGVLQGGNKVAKYSNTYGVWLDYVTPDSSYWPGTHYFDNGQKICNPRFLSKSTPADKALGFSACPVAKGVNPKYHYGDYNYMGTDLTQGSRGKAIGYPLKEMALDYTRATTPRDKNLDAKNRANFHALYNPMVWDEDDCKVLQGREMTISNVLVYLDNVCATGLTSKPYHKPSVDGSDPVRFAKPTVNGGGTGSASSNIEAKEAN